MYLVISIGAYLVIGYLLHAVIFPEKKPEVSSYFKPGQFFFSSKEGAKQTIVKQENGIVYCKAEVGPHADGPPMHIHTDFDETFEIENGELSVWVNGEVKKLKPGEKIFIPKGTPHKPFNETNDTIHFKGLVPFPEKFAYNLAQVYGMLDMDPKFGKSAGTMLQMSLLNKEGFDSYLSGPPVFIQKATSFLVIPMARLMGYKSFYEQYDVGKRMKM